MARAAFILKISENNAIKTGAANDGSIFNIGSSVHWF